MPRCLATVGPAVSRRAYKRRGPAATHLMTDWAAIVGPRIAAIGVPRKLFAGTLCIAASGPAAMELQHRATELMARINTHLGQTSVTRLRFVQDFAARPPSGPVPPLSDTRAIARAEKAVSHLAPGGLRDALARLGAVVLRPR